MRQLCTYLIILTLFFTSLMYAANNNNCSGSCRCYCNSWCGSCGSCCDSCCQASPWGYPFFAYRSTSINAARDIVGIQPFINRKDMDETSGALSVALEYTRSFRPCRIAQYLFGCDLMGGNTLAIQGWTATPNRLPCAWLADYFGLSPAFDARVSFCPRIENVIVNLDFYLGLDRVREGLYFRMHSPLTWTRWNLNMCENILNPGIHEEYQIGFLPTYMAAEPPYKVELSPPYGREDIDFHGYIERKKLPQSFTEAMSGWVTWGDMQSPMCYGLMSSCCGLTKTMLADIHAVLGWNFVLEEDYHFGLNVRAIFPTGTRPCAKFLFEPQIGDGKHYQLGVGLTSSWIMWRNEENDNNYFGVYLDANFLHLFRACQCRSFDFCCKPNSRYMLLAEVGSNDDNIRSDNNNSDSTANYQYQKSLIPAINYTTYNVDVKIAIQADIMIKFSYVSDNWSCDLGYEFWGRTGEKFCNYCCPCGCCDCGCCGSCNNCCCGPCINYFGESGECNAPCYRLCGPCCTPSCYGCSTKNNCCNTSCKQYVIKGDSFLYGGSIGQQSPEFPEGLIFDTAYPIAASQCTADIHGGQNIKQDTIEDKLNNKGVDNPQLAALSVDLPDIAELYAEAYTFDTLLTGTEIGLEQIYASFQPNLVSCNDINFCKSPSAISHKLFMHFTYAWKDRERSRKPYIGFGCEAEFSTRCSCSFAVSQWGAWLKTGFAFE